MDLSELQDIDSLHDEGTNYFSKGQFRVKEMVSLGVGA